MLKKRYILRTILIVIGIFALLACAFVAEQYYRWHICNFQALDRLGAETSERRLRD